MYTMGVDIGSASSKAVILKDGKDVVAAEVVQALQVPRRLWKWPLKKAV